jgi:hypothetical protein
MPGEVNNGENRNVNFAKVSRQPLATAVFLQRCTSWVVGTILALLLPRRTDGRNRETVSA